MARWLAVVACLAGCDLAFPIDPGASGPPGDADADVPDGAPGAGPIARYDMELDGTTVPDRSGNGLDARCVADGCPNDVSVGNGGRGVAFDGATQILTVPDVRMLRTPQFTVVVTMTPDPGDDVFRCVVGIPYASGSLNSWQLCVRSDGALQFETVHTDETPHQSFSPVGAVPDETTHQVAIEWDGTTKHIFVDAILVTSDEVPGEVLFDPQTGMHIGADGGVENVHFAGIIDDLQIFDRPLRASELFELVP